MNLERIGIRLCIARFGDDWKEREDADEILDKACADALEKCDRAGIVRRSDALFSPEKAMWCMFLDHWITASEWLAMSRRGAPIPRVWIGYKGKKPSYTGIIYRPWCQPINAAFASSFRTRKLP